MLAKVRDVVPRWLRLVDRVTPAELLDIVLAETAYGLRDPRARGVCRRARTSRSSAA